MRRVTKGGKTYVVRGDRLIEIDGVPVRGVDAKAIKATRGQRHIGVPWDYLVDVLRRIPKQSPFPLAIALLIYRRTIVCHSQTVTLPSTELTELEIDRAQKSRVLALLVRVGLIRIEQNRPGQTTKVTLLWQR
jgi:hypothetical protein